MRQALADKAEQRCRLPITPAIAPRVVSAISSHILHPGPRGSPRKLSSSFIRTLGKTMADLRDREKAMEEQYVQNDAGVLSKALSDLHGAGHTISEQDVAAKMRELWSRPLSSFEVMTSSSCRETSVRRQEEAGIRRDFFRCITAVKE
jgi:hypothetical protein